MKIETLTVKNFQLLKSEELDLRGRTVFLMGSNKVGKSSLIRAAFGIMPDEPLKEGENKGSVSIELSDKEGVKYTCTYTFSKSNQKPKLEIFNAEGKRQGSPATLFSELFNVTNFDVDGFLKLSGSKQVEAIKNLIGIDWTDVDAEYTKKFKERTEKNRDIDKVSAKLIGTVYKKDLGPIKPLEEIQAKFSEVSKHNETVLRGENTKINALNNAESYDATVVEYNKQIEAIKKETAIKIAGLNDDILKAEEYKKSSLEQADKIEAWLKLNPRKEISEIEAEQKAAIEHNKEVEENNKVKVLSDELEGLTLEVNDIEKRLSEIKDLKTNQFREAQDKGLIPVEGLSIDYEENQLRLNGLPFNSDQINTASKIIAGLEIQAALMSQGQVRIAKFEGSLLDKSNTQAVIDWARNKDIQLFIEVVSRDQESLTVQVVEEE